MKNKKESNVWGLVARLILRNRFILLAAILGMTFFLGDSVEAYEVHLYRGKPTP
jgi:hypothetical protein